MEIKKLERKGKTITAWSDEYPDKGFCFDIDDITDKNDLKAKVQIRINQEKSKEDQEAAWGAKFKNLK